MKEQNYTFIVQFPAKRIDLLLVDYFEEVGGVFSRSSIQDLIKSGNVLVNAKAVKPSKSLSGGENIEIKIPETAPVNIKPQNIPIRVVYEDDYIIVINKTPDMVVHPAPGNYDGTLVNAVFYHCKGKLSTIGGETRSGVVHRLDKETSGLIVMAKDNAAHLDLARQFADKSAKRHYTAVIWGVPDKKEDRWETFFGRHPVDRKKFTSKLTSGKKAITNYYVIKDNGEESILNVILETGRTHQIRVHMYDHGYAIIGDPVYGKRKQKAVHIKRQALHARSLTILHPIFKQRMTFFSPLESDIKQLIRELDLC
ncbi:MAG: RluA family pseudouridine synthase [Proteobacteria bacterium]|nr:RluA family pseudouridine synthase [Pseudomonadota bacterium]